jgi:hypothetical protein
MLRQSDKVPYYRAMARRCGIWPTARAMRKAGYSIWQCRWVLFSREDYPVLRQALYLSPRRYWRVEGE